MNIYYPSKKDSWIAVIIWGVIGIMLADGIFGLQWGVFMVPDPISNPLFKLLFLLAVPALLLWIWFGTGYYIDSESLKVHYGPYKKQIRLEEIEKVVPNRDPFLAPALSADRLEIHYGPGKFIKVSPKHKEEFLQRLRKNIKK
ncbi:PH domain-containing protein [Halobacillus dabanensis]|uniref:PH domain-containing protein n=1 Tax=Halobacillus dabanensis TaxID=240302 RepID=A0A1I3QBD3_HALDA|nr:PH domain-containing protein [Halobacillus dabanensis]SFJ30677.1 PH domain-containing protein [Halobacillus dabanensis]